MHLCKIAFVISIFALISCGNRERNGEKLPKLKDELLLSRLDSLASQSFDFFYSKITTNYKDSAQSVNFKTSLRLINDSAANMLITYARFPVVNAVITKDSLKMTNKREKCYILEEVAFIKESYGIEFSHRNIEELFLGLPIGYDANREYHRVKDPINYTLSSHEKKEIDDLAKDEIVFYYDFTNDAKQLKSVRIESPSDSTQLRIKYEEFELIGAQNFPKKAIVTIQRGDQNILAELNYNKSRTDENEGIHFIIPESYEECE